jgi:hypothetical protein
MRHLWISTFIEELEVEDWVDSFPLSSSSTASSDGARGARVVVRVVAGLTRLLSAAAVAGEAHEWQWRAKLTSGGGGRSSRAVATAARPWAVAATATRFGSKAVWCEPTVPTRKFRPVC